MVPQDVGPSVSIPVYCLWSVCRVSQERLALGKALKMIRVHASSISQLKKKNITFSAPGLIPL